MLTNTKEQTVRVYYFRKFQENLNFCKINQSRLLNLFIVLLSPNDQLQPIWTDLNRSWSGPIQTHLKSERTFNKLLKKNFFKNNVGCSNGLKKISKYLAWSRSFFFLRKILYWYQWDIKYFHNSIEELRWNIIILIFLVDI